MRPRTILAAVFAIFLLLSSALAHPGSSIFVDARGQIFFVDTGSGVWKIDTQGRLTKLPGVAFHWFALDTNNRFQDSRMPFGPGWEIRVAGRGPTLVISSDYPIAIGTDGNAYYPLPGNNGRLRIMRLRPDGRENVFAELPADSHRWLNGLAAAPDGSLYYTEDSRIRRIDAKGQVSTVVANVTLARCEPVPGKEAASGIYLRGLAVEASGTIYVTASGCGSLLKITPDRKITTIHQLQAPWSPTAVAVSGKDIYVLEYLHTASDDRREWLPRIRKITSDGKSAIIAGIDKR